MTYVFALAHLTGVAGAGALAASGLDALARRYADREHGGWFASLDPAGNVLDTAKANYAHAHVLLAASSALAAGIPGADAALEAATAAIDRHFWSDAEGLALESWNAGFTEPEAYRGANSNMHSVEAYLAAGDVTGRPAWHQRAASIAGYLVNVQARAHALADTRALRPELAAPPGLQRRPPQRPVPAARHHPRPFLRMGPAAADPGGSPARSPGCSRRRPRCSTPPSPTPGSGTVTRA